MPVQMQKSATPNQSAQPEKKPVPEIIFYEQPLNEKVRSLLRLDFLFNQLYAALNGDSLWDSRSAVAGVLDVYSIISRADIKSELLKELERYSGLLEALEKNPNVDSSKLTTVLDEIDVYIDKLHSMTGPVAGELRQNELLTSIRQRISVPGGACEFDLPSYHFWLSQPLENRTSDLRSWLAPFEVIRASIALIVRLVRESTPSTQQTAAGGFYQQTLDPSVPTQLIRVGLPPTSPYYAEISGGKHRFSVRFMALKLFDRDTATDQDVVFELACCTL